MIILQSGFVHVVLRELPRAGDDPPNKVKIELAVLDTGKVREHFYTPVLRKR